MKFYAYTPTIHGNEPTALFRRGIFTSNSVDTAKIVARELYGHHAHLFFYIDFFNRKTFTRLL